MFRIYDGRNAFYQWDIDRKIIVRDSSIIEVHFCNRTGDCALVGEVYKDGDFNVVNVPNILLQSSIPIRVYGFTDNCTKYEGYFDIIPRTKPADYVYTETEVKCYENYEKRLAALEEGGGAVQPDWAQNDESAKDFIKNRTHYEEEVTDETTLQFDVFYPYETYSKVKDNIETAKFLVDGKEFVWVRRQNAHFIFPFYISDGVKEYKITNAVSNNQYKLMFDATNPNEGKNASVTHSITKTYIYKLDEKYLPNYLTSPFLLNADSAETYLNDFTYGDEALEAIKKGRQILVKVPNASGDNYVASYSPVYMYQVPNYANQYLYLFFLRDEKQTLDLTALGMGTIELPTYGQLKMLLSQEYNNNPLA